MADDSLGQGIGLQGRLPRNFEQWSERDYAQQGRLRAQKAKEDDSAYKDLLKDVFVDEDKIHPILTPDAQNLTAKAVGQIRDLKSSGNPNWKNDAYVVARRAGEGLKELADISKANYFPAEAQAKQGMLSDESNKLAEGMKANYGKGKDAFIKWAKDNNLNTEWGNVSDQGGITMRNKPKDMNIERLVRNDANDYIGHMGGTWNELKQLGHQDLIEKTSTPPQTHAEALQLEAEISKKVGHPVVIPSVEERLDAIYQDEQVRQNHQYVNRSKKMDDAGLKKSFDETYAPLYGTQQKVTAKAIPQPRESEKKTTEGNTYTIGKIQHEYTSDPDGTEHVVYTKVGGGDIPETTFYGMDGKPFKGSLQKVDYNKNKDKIIGINVVKSVISEDKPIRIDTKTGELLAEGQMQRDVVDENGKPVKQDFQQGEIKTILPHEKIEIVVPVPASDMKNVANTKPAGASFWDVRKAITGGLEAPKGATTGISTPRSVKSTRSSTSERGSGQATPKDDFSQYKR